MNFIVKKKGSDEEIVVLHSLNDLLWFFNSNDKIPFNIEYVQGPQRVAGKLEGDYEYIVDYHLAAVTK